MGLMKQVPKVPIHFPREPFVMLSDYVQLRDKFSLASHLWHLLLCYRDDGDIDGALRHCPFWSGGF